MYEKLELERIKLEQERIKFEKERFEKEYRFRCFEIAKEYADDKDSLLEAAKKFFEFINSK